MMSILLMHPAATPPIRKMSTLSRTNSSSQADNKIHIFYSDTCVCVCMSIYIHKYGTEIMKAFV